MAPIAIDIGIGDTLQAINTILARRENERATVWDSLACQLEAVSLTVGELDRMYFVLLAEIEDVLAQAQPSRERLDAVIDQASTYCTDGRLTLRLVEWRGIIQSAAFNRALKHRRYRVLASTLRSIDDPLGRYIERLYRLQHEYASGVSEFARPIQTGDTPESCAHDQQWDLVSVLDLLRSVAVQLVEADKLGQDLADPKEACEEAIRNYDRAVSLALVHLIGFARQDLAMERL
jgi:hypothetical protein